MTNPIIEKGDASILSPEAIADGFSITEPDDHVLELRQHGKVLARFSQSGVRIENLLKEIEIGKYRN